MTYSPEMTDGDDRDAVVVLPPPTPALLLNKAALLDALEGICSLAVFFKVDDLGSNVVETHVHSLAGPCTLPAANVRHTSWRAGNCFRWQETSLRNALGYLINDTLGDDWQAAVGIDGELSIDVASRTVLIAGRSPATGELSFCRVF